MTLAGGIDVKASLRLLIASRWPPELAGQSSRLREATTELPTYQVDWLQVAVQKVMRVDGNPILGRLCFNERSITWRSCPDYVDEERRWERKTKEQHLGPLLFPAGFLPCNDFAAAPYLHFYCLADIGVPKR